MVTLELAANILTLGKRLAPDKFSKPDRATAEAWARCLRDYPPQLWEDAVHRWAKDFVGESMATPRALNAAAKATVSDWESDPVRGPQLRAHRERLRDERDKQLAKGTFGQIRGYRPPKAIEHGRPNVDADVLATIRQVARGKRVG